jgi:hypothetical protein
MWFRSIVCLNTLGIVVFMAENENLQQINTKPNPKIVKFSSND